MNEYIIIIVESNTFLSNFGKNCINLKHSKVQTKAKMNSSLIEQNKNFPQTKYPQYFKCCV